MSACVALVTCDRLLPDGDSDDQLLLASCVREGLEVEVVSWTDPVVQWERFDLVVLRSTWDYAARRAQFLRWAGGVARLQNPATVIAVNTDKSYLLELADAGLPVVPTRLVRPNESFQLPEAGGYVLKPTVGAGSKGAGRFDAAVPGDAERARRHGATLHAAGRAVLIQPYIDSVDVRGETALIFVDGRFSHAVCKSALLPVGAQHSVDEYSLYLTEEITARTPSPDELRLAETVYEYFAAELTEPLLYARIDLLAGVDGPLLIEAELTEPSLFLAVTKDDIPGTGAGGGGIATASTGPVAGTTARAYAGTIAGAGRGAVSAPAGGVSARASGVASPAERLAAAIARRCR